MLTNRKWLLCVATLFTMDLLLSKFHFFDSSIVISTSDLVGAKRISHYSTTCFTHRDWIQNLWEIYTHLSQSRSLWAPVWLTVGGSTVHEEAPCFAHPGHCNEDPPFPFWIPGEALAPTALTSAGDKGGGCVGENGHGCVGGKVSDNDRRTVRTADRARKAADGT